MNAGRIRSTSQIEHTLLFSFHVAPGGGLLTFTAHVFILVMGVASEMRRDTSVTTPAREQYGVRRVAVYTGGPALPCVFEKIVRPSRLSILVKP